ncbi:MAG TPA: recombination mediator RecR [Planctomycetota bacterium]|nr:recombination mediator RecR [Planctomycetota bacterium]
MFLRMEAESSVLQRLIDELERLPGIGRKTAERLAYWVLNAPAEEALGLAEAIRAVKSRLRPCSRCYHIAEGELCAICDDPSRDATTICVVEQSKDLIAIEASGVYRGVYHVLQGTFAPLEGISPKDLTIVDLLERLRAGVVEEVIIATNPNFEGEGTALYLAERLRASSPNLRVTRLARGMPSGSNLEHVSRNIVADAIEGRRELSTS